MASFSHVSSFSHASFAGLDPKCEVEKRVEKLRSAQEERDAQLAGLRASAAVHAQQLAALSARADGEISAALVHLRLWVFTI